MARRALIFAVQRYPKVSDSSISSELEDTIKRAEDFRKWLSDKWTNEGVPPDEQQVIFCSEPAVGGGRGAEIDDLKDSLDELVKTGRDSTNELYFYFSGHGFTFDKKVTRSSMLIASDYRSMKLSGDKCANVDWIVLWLTMNMGAGRHYYFIDACNNVFDGSVIQPPDALLPNDPQSGGEPDSFLLQSSPPKATAPGDSEFAKALLDGLDGRGTAKVWDEFDPEAMVVRFDTLREFVKKRLAHKIHQSVKGDGGDASGLLLTLKPPPPSACTIRVLGGDATGTVVFDGSKRRYREALQGASGRYQVAPDTYRIKLELDVGAPFPTELSLALYDDADATFSLDPALLPQGRAEESASVVVPPDTALILKDSDNNETHTLRGGTRHAVPRGRYSAILKDTHANVIKTDELNLGETSGDVTEWARAAVRDLIAQRFPRDPNGGIWFSRSVGRAVHETDLDIWLALLGASKILEGAPDILTTEAERFPLESFASEEAGSSPIFVLGAFEVVETKLEVSVRAGGLPDWEVASVTEIAAIRNFRARPAPGPLLVSLRTSEDAVPYTLATTALPNRVTLITVTPDGERGFSIGQYFVPIGHLVADFPYKVHSTRGNALSDVLATSRMMRSFQRRKSVWSDLQYYVGKDLADGNWRDPMTMLLAAYSSMQRRKRGDLPKLIDTLAALFGNIPDTAVLKSMWEDRKPTLSMGLPIFMDGFVAAGGKATDLPAGSSLDYSSIWTAWHELPARR